LPYVRLTTHVLDVAERMQLTTTFVGDQLAVGGQIGWSYAGQLSW